MSSNRRTDTSLNVILLVDPNCRGGDLQVFLKFAVNETSQLVSSIAAEDDDVIDEIHHPSSLRVYPIPLGDLLVPHRLKSKLDWMLSLITLSDGQTLQFVQSNVANKINLERILYASNNNNVHQVRINVQIDVVNMVFASVNQNIKLPASKESVQALEKMEFNKGGEHTNCMVCTEAFSSGTWVTRMPCMHVFHGECILEWLKEKNTCPLCRFQLPIDYSFSCTTNH